MTETAVKEGSARNYRFLGQLVRSAAREVKAPLREAPRFLSSQRAFGAAIAHAPPLLRPAGCRDQARGHPMITDTMTGAPSPKVCLLAASSLIPRWRRARAGTMPN